MGQTFRLPTSLRLCLAIALAAAALSGAPAQGAADVAAWKREFPRTDFARASIPLDEIVTDGPRRDTIPPIDAPRFVPAADAKGIGPFEPVLGLIIDGDARAYPLRILLWHEIVNDVVGGVPVLVSYCPLCNSGVVFDRRLGGETLIFGNTGRIRHYDMVMYDRQSESWWQQFLGQAIVGARTGQTLTPIPSRLESLVAFRTRAPPASFWSPTIPPPDPTVRAPSRGSRTARPACCLRFPCPTSCIPWRGWWWWAKRPGRSNCCVDAVGLKRAGWCSNGHRGRTPCMTLGASPAAGTWATWSFAKAPRPMGPRSCMT